MHYDMFQNNISNIYFLFIYEKNYCILKFIQNCITGIYMCILCEKTVPTDM